MLRPTALLALLVLAAACGGKATPATTNELPFNVGADKAPGPLPPPGPSGEMYEVAPGLSVPVEWVACDETPCTALETSCCDYCSGGQVVGVNVDHADELRPYVAQYECNCTSKASFCPELAELEIACMTGVCIPVTPDVTGEWQ